jgi:hypothetical protein
VNGRPADRAAAHDVDGGCSMGTVPMSSPIMASAAAVSSRPAAGSIASSLVTIQALVGESPEVKKDACAIRSAFTLVPVGISEGSAIVDTLECVTGTTNVSRWRALNARGASWITPASMTG